MQTDCRKSLVAHQPSTVLYLVWCKPHLACCVRALTGRMVAKMKRWYIPPKLPWVLTCLWQCWAKTRRISLVRHPNIIAIGSPLLHWIRHRLFMTIQACWPLLRIFHPPPVSYHRVHHLPRQYHRKKMTQRWTLSLLPSSISRHHHVRRNLEVQLALLSLCMSMVTAKASMKICTMIHRQTRNHRNCSATIKLECIEESAYTQMRRIWYQAKSTPRRAWLLAALR